MVYRFGLSTEQAVAFDKLILWVRKNSAQLPLTFLLGFYVSLVVKRWWEQYVKLPWLDEVATYLKVAITKKKEKKEEEDDETEDNENLKIRRTIVRYCMLSYVLCLRRISSQVMHHYPSVENLVSRGLVREDEADLIGKEDPEDLHRHGGSNWWLPIKWSVDIIRTAQIDGRFVNPPSYTALVGKVNDFRKSLTRVASYGHVTIPLVYTQVVHLAVYIHFAGRLVGDQCIIWRKEGDEEVGMYPIFLMFKFLFFFGWLNVASTLYNPFGCDDEDFELIDLINRHIMVATKIVDEENNFPEVRADDFWNPPEGVEIGNEWVPSLENRMEIGNQMKLKNMEDMETNTIIDEETGGNWSRCESRDQGK